MEVVIEILRVEPVPTQVVPPLPSTEASMELALVSSDQTKIVPAAIEDAPTLGSTSEVAIERAVVRTDRSSPAEEVEGGLKRKNSHLPQELATTASGKTGKKRRLVKESELVSSRKVTSSSSNSRKPSLDKADKGKGKEGQTWEVSKGLPTALIYNEGGLPFQLGPDFTPTSIAELLSNHVFEPSPNLNEPRM